MYKKGARQTVFVCSGIANGKELASDEFAASSTEEAASLFLDKYKVKPKSIFGPFFKKRTQILETTTVLKFSNQTKKAIYEGWFVTAFVLSEPENYAYLVFNRRVDGQKLPPPKGTITVPISELRII